MTKINFGIYLIVAITVSMLISCIDIGSVSLQIEKAVFKKAANNKGMLKTFGNNFQSKGHYCLDKIGYNNPDYIQCLIDESSKLKDDNINEKGECCDRVLNYECMKKFLTSECGVSKQEVDSHDEEHFAFWNHLNIPEVPHNCSGGRQ